MGPLYYWSQCVRNPYLTGGFLGFLGFSVSFSESSSDSYDSSSISNPGYFSFQNSSLLWSRTVIIVRLSSLTVIFGFNSFSLFLRAMLSLINISP